MFSSPYLQHALYSIACLSLSINLLSLRRSSEEDKSRVEARTSILESVKERLSKAPLHQDSDLDSKELDRLMRLANKMAAAGSGSDRTLGDDVSWSDIFSGKAPKIGSNDSETSRWEKEDLEKCAYLLVVRLDGFSCILSEERNQIMLFFCLMFCSSGCS
jgi:hypothetical protein